jgi:DNA repair exonuclease SbcCD ATPase subunit
MILRDIVVENWRCIRRLELSDLPDGIVLFSGPNGTGKTSLVKALRACLYDADHDTGGGNFKKQLPWSGARSPRVAVSFEVGEITYRLSKVFSKSKEGRAILEKRVGGGWQVEEDAPKEASRKARLLLGAERSQEGLNQLLWLAQGEISLPDKLDQSLEGKLAAVLGTMITGRDFSFCRILEKRLGQWFTEGGKYAKHSAVTRFEESRTELQKDFHQAQEELARLERDMAALQDLEENLPAFRRDLKSAEEELRLLGAERERSRVRLAGYESARRQHQQAVKECELAKSRLAELQGELQALSLQEETLTKAEKAVADLAQIVVQRENIHGQRTAELEDARRQRQELTGLEAELEDLGKLTEAENRCGGLTNILDWGHRVEEECRSLDAKLKNMTAPDEDTLKLLRRNRQEARELRACLDAEAWNIRIQAERPINLELRLDSRESQRFEIPVSGEKSFSVGQQAQLHIPGFGAIELARAKTASNQIKSARRLAALDKEWTETLGTFQEEPGDESSLDRLLEKRMKKETLVSDLKRLREQLQEKCPQGLGQVEANRAAVLNEIKILRDRWALFQKEPPTEDLEEKRAQFRGDRDRLEKLKWQCEMAEKEARSALGTAAAQLQAEKEKTAALRARCQTRREALAQRSSEEALAAAVEEARRAVQLSEAELNELRLSEEEQTVLDRYTQAQAVLEQRHQRYQEQEKEIHRLRGVLQGHEGLVTRRDDAEAALLEIEAKLEQEKIEAEAHRRLCDLFHEARDQQVGQVMGPIAGRVLDWASKIGLENYREVKFEDAYLPHGLARPESNGADVVLLQDESLGIYEQLTLLVRLALGGILAQDEPALAILDDPLAHADASKHRRMLDILRQAAEGNRAANPPTGRMQILILTCHPERFDYLRGVRHIDLASAIVRDS